MAPFDSPDRLRAWTSVMWFTTLGLAASGMGVVSWHFVGGIVIWQWYLALATTGVLTLLVLVRRRMAVATSISIFLACAAVILFASGYTNEALVRSGVQFDGFLGYKLMALAIAIMAPFPTWLAFTLIFVCAVGPVVHFLLLTPELRAAFLVQEPWTAFIYAAIASIVLRQRLHGLHLERTLERIKTEQQAARNLATIFLGLRDLTNTPLQSIELTSRLLDAEVMTGRQGAAHLDRSILRLRELSHTLATYEENVDWDDAVASFNAGVMLQERLHQINKGSGDP